MGLPPDFLSTLLASRIFMRLSSKAHTGFADSQQTKLPDPSEQAEAASQELGFVSGRDFSRAVEAQP